MRISLFGWLDKFEIWQNLSYKLKGTILRAAKTGLSAAVAALITANASGTLIPSETAPWVAVLITSILVSADKFVRELGIERQTVTLNTDNVEDSPEILDTELPVEEVATATESVALVSEETTEDLEDIPDTDVDIETDIPAGD